MYVVLTCWHCAVYVVCHDVCVLSVLYYMCHSECAVCVVCWVMCVVHRMVCVCMCGVWYVSWYVCDMCVLFDIVCDVQCV